MEILESKGPYSLPDQGEKSLEKRVLVRGVREKDNARRTPTGTPHLADIHQHLCEEVLNTLCCNVIQIRTLGGKLL
jgi:hypothetical protein